MIFIALFALWLYILAVLVAYIIWDTWRIIFVDIGFTSAQYHKLQSRADGQGMSVEEYIMGYLFRKH